MPRFAINPGWNQRRSAEAAQATIPRLDAALAAFAGDPYLNGLDAAAARLRIEHPDLSLRQIADEYNLSKDAFSARLRRFLCWAVRRAAEQKAHAELAAQG